MDENDLKVLKKRGKCTYTGNCFFRHDGECYRLSYCKDRMDYVRTCQTLKG
jgi:hypothetical protein